MSALADWPEPERREPRRSSPGWAVRAPLARWLREEAQRAGERYGRYSVLDVGCGAKPYYPFFAPWVGEYIGVDSADNPLAELHGRAEELPVEDSRFDVVLCTQVLEHADDPARVVRELARVTRGGGRVLASTHGVQMYHPNPDDYWRWTHTGLARLFGESAEWSVLEVHPSSGTASCLAMLLSIYADLALRRIHAAPLARAVVAGLNRAGEAIDARSPRLREPGHTTLHANFHVIAERPA